MPPAADKTTSENFIMNMMKTNRNEKFLQKGKLKMNGGSNK